MAKYLYLLLLLCGLISCAPPIEPVSVTRPATLTATAVPPTPTPPATSTTAPRPTIAPTNTPDPAAAQAHFLETLQFELNGRQFDAIERKMDSSFLAGIYPIGTGTTPAEAQDTLMTIQARLLPQMQSPTVTFYALDAAEIPPHLTAATLFPENAEEISLVGSSGWGLNGSGQALVYLRAEGDIYFWAGLIVGYGDFAVNLDLETIDAPPGLIYSLENGRYEYWQIDANGEPQLLIAHDGRLSLNPTATLALAAEQGNEFVTLFDLADGSSEVIGVDGRLMGDSLRLNWLDEETALLLLTDEPSVLQGINGFPSLLNVLTGELTRLDVELSVYDQPTISANGTIAFKVNQDGELFFWRDGMVTAVSIPGFADGEKHLYGPVLSPDEMQVVGQTHNPDEPDRATYGLASLDQTLLTFLHSYDPVPTDAVLPHGVHWSPDGHFVALSPPSWDIIEGGTWLVENSVDETRRKIFLGPGSSSPVWLDANRFVFTAVWNGQYGLQLYDLSTNNRVWLNTPQLNASLRNGFWLNPEKPINPVQVVARLE